MRIKSKMLIFGTLKNFFVLTVLHALFHNFGTTPIFEVVKNVLTVRAPLQTFSQLQNAPGFTKT